jgi:hypothetical protein
MFNFYDIINMLYTKKKTNVEPDTQLNLTLCKWLSYDRDNLTSLKNILKYQFSLSPLHFFYMIYFAIPKKFKAPFLKKIQKIEEKEDKLLNRIQEVLGYSNNSMLKNKSVIQSILNQDPKYWSKQLGVK